MRTLAAGFGGNSFIHGFFQGMNARVVPLFQNGVDVFHVDLAGVIHTAVIGFV